MAKAKKRKQQAPQPPSSYELLGMRLQRQINGPKAQKEKTTVIAKELDEKDEDWSQILADLETIEEVTLIPQDDGSVRLRWTAPE